MVEEAVSYNELDYISVSAARVRSALLGGAGGEFGGWSSPLQLQGCQEHHGGVFLWGALSTGSSLAIESLRLGELEVIPPQMPLLQVPSLLVSSHGQQSDR